MNFGSPVTASRWLLSGLLRLIVTTSAATLPIL